MQSCSVMARVFLGASFLVCVSCGGPEANTKANPDPDEASIESAAPEKNKPNAQSVPRNDRKQNSDDSPEKNSNYLREYTTEEYTEFELFGLKVNMMSKIAEQKIAVAGFVSQPIEYYLGRPIRYSLCRNNCAESIEISGDSIENSENKLSSFVYKKNFIDPLDIKVAAKAYIDKFGSPSEKAVGEHSATLRYKVKLPDIEGYTGEIDKVFFGMDPFHPDAVRFGVDNLREMGLGTVPSKRLYCLVGKLSANKLNEWNIPSDSTECGIILKGDPHIQYYYDILHPYGAVFLNIYITSNTITVTATRPEGPHNTVGEMIEREKSVLSWLRQEADIRENETLLPGELSHRSKVTSAENNAQNSANFMSDNVKKPGVKATASGLQYFVLTQGKAGGKKPSDTSKVRVHYEGKLVNGAVFDSSFARGQPTEFSLNAVIPGWTEGVQLMSEGDKYRFFIPPALGYGAEGTQGGPIGPNEALIFEVELLKVLD